MNNNYYAPALVFLDDYDGNFQKYDQEVYRIFVDEFVKSKPKYLKKRFALKKHPFTEGKEATYYHITSNGTDEKNRIPDLRRMERIRFPKSFIENHKEKEFKVWKNKRGRNTRVLIFNENEKYLVILEDRGEYVLLWTAYYIEYSNRIRKLLKEYNNYKKAETA